MGRPSLPRTITQKAFDFDAGHLRRLVRLPRSERAEAEDLWAYTQDLRFGEAIQGPLLAYLLPFCLQAWHDDLRGTATGYGAFVEHFYPVLADRHVFDTHLNPKQAAAVSRFMQSSILEEIDDQRGLAYSGMSARPYPWIRALTTHGVLLPDVDRLWTAWWSLETIGRAVSAVQYVSALMYDEDENPVFAPWTRDGGGGPLGLWDFEGHLYAHRWMEPNVEFLTRTLSVSAVSELIGRAVARLANEPEQEIAAHLQAALPLRVELLQARCAELPALLATIGVPGSLLEWSV